MKTFKAHVMYDPKTGKGYKATKEADHIKYKKKGYKHKEEMGENFLSTVNPRLDNWINKKVHKKEHTVAHREFLKVWRKDKDKKLYKGDRLALAGDVARQYRHATGRTLIAFHQELVSKGQLPKHMDLLKDPKFKKRVIDMAMAPRV